MQTSAGGFAVRPQAAVRFISNGLGRGRLTANGFLLFVRCPCFLGAEMNGGKDRCV